MDNHSTSWAATALVFAIGYGVGAASAAVALGLWRVLRRLAGEN